MEVQNGRNRALSGGAKHKTERLQKLISECGIASRRKAEEMIAAGRVKVNGRAAKVGDVADPAHDRVTVDGALVHTHREKTYIALNKPRGYVTTLSDELGRKTVTELIKGVDARVYPVGRLDKDSEGLLLLTDDGEFANALTHPSHHVQKVYHVSVKPGVSEEQLARIRTGIMLDRRMTAPARASLLRSYPDRAVIELTLFEGRNREIRRMCEELELEIARLSRVAVGSVKLGSLPSGGFRMLEQKEVHSLLRMSRAASGGRGDKPEGDASDD